MSFPTSPEELFLMIGEREFQIWKWRQVVKERDDQIAEQDRIHKQLMDYIREIEAENGRLEQPNNHLQLLNRRPAGPEGQGLRRSEPLPERTDESGGRDDQAAAVPGEVPGEGQRSVE